jgi:CubicO group peptidase (beta-lactamase class C family)
VWETTSPQSLGWKTDKIPAFYDYLEQTNSKAFIVLKDGKIVMEKYFGTFKQDSLWYWASAGKTVTSTLIGIAQAEGKLVIQDKSSKYLGNGWTSLSATQEDKITIRHQLTMTSGLDDSDDKDCTLPSCLKYKADAGTRWAYHNAPYTILDKVIENATGQTFNQYYNAKLRSKIGMNGLFIKSGYNNVNYSTARSMARFGLLMLNKGKWNTEQILPLNYFNEAINTSQNLNLSYGYLWWLNGKSSFMIPTLQTIFNGSLASNAPADMYSALGKNGQIINIVPSQNLVLIRMGNSDGSPVPVTYDNEIWKRFKEILATSTEAKELSIAEELIVYPNPTADKLFLANDLLSQKNEIQVFNHLGESQKIYFENNAINVSNWQNGVYFLSLLQENKRITKRFVVLK